MAIDRQASPYRRGNRYEQLQGYAGCVTARDDGRRFDVGLSYSHFTGDSTYDFAEGYVGVLAATLVALARTLRELRDAANALNDVRKHLDRQFKRELALKPFVSRDHYRIRRTPDFMTGTQASSLATLPITCNRDGCAPVAPSRAITT